MNLLNSKNRTRSEALGFGFKTSLHFLLFCQPFGKDSVSSIPLLLLLMSCEENSPSSAIEPTILAEDTAQLKKEIGTLIHLISNRQQTCNATAEETRYMREYVESFISMTDMNKKSRK